MISSIMPMCKHLNRRKIFWKVYSVSHITNPNTKGKKIFHWDLTPLKTLFTQIFFLLFHAESCIFTLGIREVYCISCETNQHWNSAEGCKCVPEIISRLMQKHIYHAEFHISLLVFYSTFCFLLSKLFIYSCQGDLLEFYLHTTGKKKTNK